MLVKEDIKQGFIDACAQVMNDTEIDRDAALDKVMGNFAQVIIDAIRSATITAPNGPCTIQ
jgi:hypothetical protein